MNIIIINIILIPITALIDYFVFRNYMKKIYGDIKIWYFLPACFLELMMFNLGYIYAEMTI